MCLDELGELDIESGGGGGGGSGGLEGSRIACARLGCVEGLAALGGRLAFLSSGQVRAVGSTAGPWCARPYRLS